jgi:hypothetical protein
MTTASGIIHVTVPNSTITLTNVNVMSENLRAGNASSDTENDTAFLVIEKLHDLPTP